MIERTMRLFIVVLLVGCLLATAPALAAGTLDLTPPPFIVRGEQGEDGCIPAFNSTPAGISSYVLTGQAIDIGLAVTAFDQTLIVDGNHTVGEIKIYNYGTTFTTQVYVDKYGNIVAYYPKSTPTSALISWEGVTFASPTIVDFTTNQAIKKLCTKTGISYDAIKGDIRHYNFDFPDAEKVLIFVSGVPGANNEENVHFQFPTDFTLYEASGSLVHGNIYVDSNPAYIASASSTRTFSYGSYLPKGVPHTLKFRTTSTSGAVATLILYTEG